MKIEYKIVDAIRELLREAEQDNYIDGSEADFDRGNYYGLIDGLQKAYNKASVIADGFE